MASLYHPQVWAILILMILFGAARSVCVKLFYQLGFEYPLFVSLLFVLGQALALPMFYLSKCFAVDEADEAQTQEQTEEGESDHSNKPVADTSSKQLGSELTGEHENDAEERHATKSYERWKAYQIKSLSSSFRDRRPSNDSRRFSDQFASSASFGTLANAKRQSIIFGEDFNYSSELFGSSNTMETTTQQLERSRFTHVSERTREQRERKLGSTTGLTRESMRAAQQYLQCIPRWARPIIPSVFNLANATLRMVALMFVAASIAEMLIGGLELSLSVIVARLIRKRQVSKVRWVGVGIVMIGLVLVGGTDVIAGEKENNGSSSTDQIIGITLIFFQCVTAVLRDISEEIFLQEGGIPAMWLTGMEGCFGLLLGIPLYFWLGGALFNENPEDALSSLGDSTFLFCWTFVLVAVFNVAGILNVLSTAVTSSMTRNVWKNFRALVVWVAGLLIFYLSGNDALGEPWLIPESFIVLLGFFIMASGVFVYYQNREQQQQEPAFKNDGGSAESVLHDEDPER